MPGLGYRAYFYRGVCYMKQLQHFIKIHSVIKYAGMFPPVAGMQEAIALVTRCHIKSEIIGEWLYCFTTPLIGFQFEAIGFWYSFTHRAYVFSNTEKESSPDGETLDEIRARLGCCELWGESWKN
jgi:hypothetical protein